MASNKHPLRRQTDSNPAPGRGSSVPAAQPPQDLRWLRTSSAELVLQGENPSVFEALAATFDDQFKPADIYEDCLVQRMVRCEHSLLRISRVEDDLRSEPEQDYSAALSGLDRYKATVRRDFRQAFRSLVECRRVRSELPSHG